MENRAMHFFYGTVPGRSLMKLLLKVGLPRAMAAYLSSPLSRRMIPRYIEKHRIPMEEFEQEEYSSFADFFVRKRGDYPVDLTPEHLISPCDGLLSVYEIEADSSFSIKGSHYRLCDLLEDPDIEGQYLGGTCLIFRLTPSDYHRYAYIDSGYIHDNHYIEGKLHSVQPIACKKYPVYRLNRRCWTVLETEHFGQVVQIEVGALAVGGIVQEAQNTDIRKGDEMGHFELCGSTIVLLLEKGRVTLLPEIHDMNGEGREYRVRQGMKIGDRCP